MEGGGNDFILLAPEYYPLVQNQKVIQKWCDRHRGIGADGLISLDFSAHADANFKMIYHNSDGSSDCFCGNGARCAVAFAHMLKELPQFCTFEAQDGLHTAKLHGPEDIEISLRPTALPQKVEEGWFIDTGSRHFSLKVSQPSTINLNELGPHWRHHQAFQPEGTNVNFWTENAEGLYLRTFEKGVEAETLACGTGIVAVALIHHFEGDRNQERLQTAVRMKGGSFIVRAEKSSSGYDNITLRGPIRHVFTGTIEI